MHQNETDINLGRVLPNQPITIHTRLDDQAEGDVVGAGIDVAISVTRMGITVAFDGYGDAVHRDGHGAPILIEHYTENPVVRVWGDIGQEDPTHNISLAGANEATRSTAILHRGDAGYFSEDYPCALEFLRCEGCDGSGIRPDSDPGEGLFKRTIQRCDTCQKYDDDYAAALAWADQTKQLFELRDRNTGLPLVWTTEDPKARPVCVPVYELPDVLQRLLEKQAGKK